MLTIVFKQLIKVSKTFEMYTCMRPYLYTKQSIYTGMLLHVLSMPGNRYFLLSGSRFVISLHVYPTYDNNILITFYTL